MVARFGLHGRRVMDIVERLLARITGGRPMVQKEYRFSDPWGRAVYYYQDKFGRMWMATSSWAWFRVPAIYAKATGGE